MFTSPLKQLRQSTWLSAIPDQIEVPTVGSRSARSVSIERASIDDIAFALIPLNKKRSDLTQVIMALEDTMAMARKQGATGSDIAISAASRELEARK